MTSLPPAPPQLVRQIGLHHWETAIFIHLEERMPDVAVISSNSSGWNYILEYNGIEHNKHIYHGMIFHLSNIESNMDNRKIIDYINDNQIQPLYHYYWKASDGEINLMH